MPKNNRFYISEARKREQQKGLISKALQSGLITPDDAELIREFVAELVATSSISVIRQYKVTNQAINNRNYLHNEYRSCTIADIYTAISELQTDADPVTGDVRFNPTTQSERIKNMKRFFLWMNENGYSEIDLKKLKKIKAPKPSRLTVTADEILTEDEVKEIIDTCRTSRDRALISVLYEGGFRIGEIGSLTWGQVKISEDRIVINTDEKTGKPRYVPLMSSRAYLLEWKNDYPLQITPDSFVFLTYHSNEPIQYRAVAKQIQKIISRTSLTKKIHPHLFRHSRITHMLQRHMPETVIKLIMWGDVNTEQLATYQHLVNEDIDAAIYEMNGIERRDSKKERKGMKPIQCTCGTVNPPNAAYCYGCGKALNASAEMSAAESRNIITASVASSADMMQIMAQMQQLQDRINQLDQKIQ